MSNDRSEQARRKAAELLNYYFRTVWEKAGLQWHGDNSTEVALMVDNLIAAARPAKAQPILTATVITDPPASPDAVMWLAHSLAAIWTSAAGTPNSTASFAAAWFLWLQQQADKLGLGVEIDEPSGRVTEQDPDWRQRAIDAEAALRAQALDGIDTRVRQTLDTAAKRGEKFDTLTVDELTDMIMRGVRGEQA
jgi:hypothetical protein